MISVHSTRLSVTRAHGPVPGTSSDPEAWPSLGQEGLRGRRPPSSQPPHPRRKQGGIAMVWESFISKDQARWRAHSVGRKRPPRPGGQLIAAGLPGGVTMVSGVALCLWSSLPSPGSLPASLAARRYRGCVGLNNTQGHRHLVASPRATGLRSLQPMHRAAGKATSCVRGSGGSQDQLTPVVSANSLVFPTSGLYSVNL